MNAIILDTLEFANKLKAGGFTAEQAETLAKEIAEVFEKLWTTRQYDEARKEE